MSPATISRAPRILRCLSLLLFLTALGTGCGEDRGAVPVLTGHQTLTDRFQPAINRSMYDLRGTVSFTDPDGDLLVLRAWNQDCGTQDGTYLEWYVQDLQGVVNGEVPFWMPVSSSCPAGEYTLRLYALDRAGNASNVMVVPYRICANPRCP